MISECVFRYILSCALLECVHDVLTCMLCVNVGSWWFTSKCSCLKSAPVHQVHQINQVIIFSVGTRQFGTKFIKNSWKSFMCFRYMMMSEKSWWCVDVGNWRFTSKCSCLKSALDALDAPDKSSHNFFSRHAAIRHKIYEKYSWKSFMCFRYIVCLCWHGWLCGCLHECWELKIYL